MQDQQGGPNGSQIELAEGGDGDNAGAAESGQGDYGSAGQENGGLSGEVDVEDDDDMERDRNDDSLGGSSDSDR